MTRPLSFPGSARGFTLLEILVALAILAVAATGLIAAATGQLRAAGSMEERLLATWVAENRLEELRLLHHFPAGEAAEEASMAGRRWRVRVAVSDTAQAHLKRVVVRVGKTDPQAGALAELTGFVRRE